jgi:hypothetical protein
MEEKPNTYHITSIDGSLTLGWSAQHDKEPYPYLRVYNTSSLDKVYAWVIEPVQGAAQWGRSVYWPFYSSNQVHRDRFEFTVYLCPRGANPMLRAITTALSISMEAFIASQTCQYMNAFQSAKQANRVCFPELVAVSLGRILTLTAFLVPFTMLVLLHW